MTNITDGKPICKENLKKNEINVTKKKITKYLIDISNKHVGSYPRDCT